MVDVVGAALGLAALGVAALAGLAHLPVAEKVDAERWFKLLIANMLLGEVDRAAGDAEAWRRAVIRFAPYHPAGREAHAKLGAPSAWHPPAGGAVEGELGLVAALAALPSPRARWARLFEDEAASEVLRRAPEELAEAADLTSWLGSGASWAEVIAAQGPLDARLQAALPAWWVLVRGESAAPDLLGALAAVIGERALVLELPPGTPEVAGATLAERLIAHWVALGRADARLVLVGAGAGVPALMGALLATAGLRDRVLAVVSVGGAIGEGTSGAEAGWVERHFEHGRLDTEKAGKTPYLQVAWCEPGSDPPGIVGLSARAQRFPNPGSDASAPWGVDVVDLGLLPPDPELPLGVIARALWATVVRVVVARRAG